MKTKNRILTERYPEGYKPKLEYHTSQLAIALANDDLDEMQKRLDSIQFFLNKEVNRVK